MSLFKSKILDIYNILRYDGEYLILHCSRNDIIHAPFDGIISQNGKDYILHNTNFDLYFNHIKNVKLGKVKAGDDIGIPIVDNKYQNNIATIGVKIYNNKKISDIITYLNGKDIAKDIEKVEKPKKKSTNKKKEIKNRDKS